MSNVLKTLRTLVCYLLCGGLILIPFLLLSAFALFGSRWAFNSLYSIDVAICSIRHGTMLESISARSFRLQGDKRYYYQMVIIDWLAKPFDGEGHCEQAYLWEKKVVRL